MSILGRRVSLRTVVVAALLMIFGALLPALSQEPAREIVLVVKDMAFYLDSDLNTANPTLEFKAGERVRVVVRNEDRGVTHDFAVPVTNAATRLLRSNETGTVSFDVPTNPGTYEYVCRPHLPMMRGTIRVD